MSRNFYQIPSFLFAALLFFNSPVIFAQAQADQVKVQKKTNKKKTAPKKTRIDLTPHKEVPVSIAAKKTIEAPHLKEIEGSKIIKIFVKGNRKIEADAVTSKLISREGENIDMAKLHQDIEAVFKTGYFYDVQIDRTPAEGGSNLTYIVVEKPSVVEIEYTGNSEIEQDELKEQSGIKPFEILNMTKVREAVEKMQKAYEEKGFFLAKITPKITPVKENESVKLTFQVQENEKVKVKRVTFLGNKNLTDGKLKSVMETQEGGFFSFISGSGSYKQDKFDHDVQVLQYAYFNEGYLQVKVDRPQVSVTPDKKGIYITIRIDEGVRFKVGSVDFAGDLLFERDDLNNSIEIKNSGWYVHETMLKDLRALTAKYGDLGYAYANIIPRNRLREKDREVDITFEIDKGNKVYFHKINVVGNSRTRDKVVRRELQIREGELYNETRKRESYDNVKRLGYFEEVNFNSSTPVEGADLMDIDIVVKERNTGTIQVGAGYSTYSNFIFNGKVDQINLFGRGQKLGVAVDVSSVNKVYNLNFTEPYFLDSLWSVGGDAYQSGRDITVYYEDKLGAALTLGHPLAPYLRGFLRYKYERTIITLPDKVDSQNLPNLNYNPDLYPVGTANGDTSSVTATLEYDKRNDRFIPTAGFYANASVEYAGLGGSKKYTKSLGIARYYKKIFWDMVWRNNLTYGTIRSNESVDVPFNELFRLGGPYSLRGYDPFSIAKKKSSPGLITAAQAHGYSLNDATNLANQPFGGSQEAFYQAEIEFPLITEAGIKGVLFYDVGEADDALLLENLRSDVGFGFRWFSPIGPLRFEWGFPISRRDTERPVNFQFAIGSPF